jgi:hypothetical protein
MDPQGDEGLASVEPPAPEVAADLVIAAGVAMLGLQPPEALSGGVPLLAWSGLVRAQDVVHHGAERPEDGGGSGLGQGVRLGLGLDQGLEDGLGRVAGLVGDLADGEPVAAGLADACELVHREHPFLLGGRG